jgi:hypothetical protein
MSDTQQINPTTPLSVSLPAARWNLVLTLLDGAVRSLVGEIQDQCIQQSVPQHIPARGNGAAEHFAEQP